MSKGILYTTQEKVKFNSQNENRMCFISKKEKRNDEWVRRRQM